MLVLDLFSGTGSMAFEFASRGVADVTCVDADNKCVKHLNEVIRKYDFENVSVVRSDVFRFLQQPAEPVQLIFADPPYDLPHYDRMKQLIFENGWLQPDGIFIAEHHTKNSLVKDADFLEERIYGQSAFTFYKKK